MRDILQTYKPLIDKKIIDLCAQTSGTDVPWAEDVAQRLADFSTRGKTVRGSLLLFTADLFAPHTKEDLSVAAALELLHTALLIHDDIVDHDALRRGKPSIHTQYEEYATQHQVNHPTEFGQGMALCVGDIAIFGAFSYLARLKLPQLIHQKIMQVMTQEFLIVGFGELHDIALGYQTTFPKTAEVLTMYRRKTARYTFSLPMMLGCILRNQSESVIHALEQIGENLGMIYQLQDDLLTLHGSTAVVGKTVGNDIAENKKTYAAVLLWERAEKKDQELLQTIFGKKALQQADLQIVTTLFTTYHVVEDIAQMISQLAKKTMQQIDQLPIAATQQSQFHAMVQFLKTRTS